LLQTGQLLLKQIAWPVVFPGLTSSTSSARITAIAVPVKYSFRNQPAFSAMPDSAIQFDTIRMLAIKKMVPIKPNTTIFLTVKLIIKPFLKS
jgi:hypothetical protein